MTTTMNTIGDLPTNHNDDSDTIQDVYESIEIMTVQADEGIPCYVSSLDQVLGAEYISERQRFLQNNPWAVQRALLVAEVQAELFTNGQRASKTLQQQMVHRSKSCTDESQRLDLLAVGMDRNPTSY